jgi:hypothetical protein
MARAFGVKEEDLQAVVEEALEAKMRGAARGGAEGGIGRPGLEAEERGAERPEEKRLEERFKEEGGGREVRTKEGQALLLKEEAEERAEARAEEERGAEERGAAAGRIVLLRPEAVKAAGEAGAERVAGVGQALLLKEEGAGRRAAVVLYTTPLRGEPKAGRLGEELRRQLLGWRVGPYAPFSNAPLYTYVGGGGGGEAAVSPYVVQGASAASAAGGSSYYSPSGSPEVQQAGVQQPQQAGQAAAVSPYVVQGAPQLAAEEAPPPPPIIVGGWPWYPAEGWGGRRYSPGRQRERLVL